jgi:hypothetical protein
MLTQACELVWKYAILYTPYGTQITGYGRPPHMQSFHMDGLTLILVQPRDRQANR